ncbi:protein FAM136A-like [Rhopilema esculentum]|uniref:protein FAM136A-like n=1 Tax=Rhopilema esculentum TaxID=499914 RepID=UPI0031CE6BA2|eukprot:gene11929-2497_t
MASEAQAKVQQAVEQMLSDVERQRLRPLLAQSHMCAARCYSNKISGKESLEQCTQQCFHPVQQVQEFIGKELGNFQDRLGRCARQCQDEVQDKVDSSTTHAEVTSLQQELDTCVVKCCNTHVDMVPRIMGRIKELLEQFNNDNDK